jgi:GTP-binding protein HflX
VPMIETTKREQAIVVGLVRGHTRKEVVAEYLEELILLADTAGADVRHMIIQERESIDPATFIGSGKVEEIGRLVEREQLQLVLFDDDLSPVQVRNLEKHIKCKIVDRTGLILDIFASRAKSKEAMTQVELAQLQYMLPRLTRQWTHLSKQYGGIGTKGPGETQIETDRRAIRSRITLLKEKLEQIAKERQVQRKARKYYTRVAMVGYTNAGKSTLFKHLSGAEVLVEDRLFATLDTTVRLVRLSAGTKVLLSDTVGFIRKLPPHLIASFKSTLSEVVEADVLLHVVDVSHPRFEEQIQVVKATLDELNASGKPTVLVFNKIDKLSDRSGLFDIQKSYENAVFISATRGINLNALKEKLLGIVEEGMVEHTIVFKPADYKKLSHLHEIAEVLSREYVDNRVKVVVRVSQKNEERLLKLIGRSSFNGKRMEVVQQNA